MKTIFFLVFMNLVSSCAQDEHRNELPGSETKTKALLSGLNSQPAGPAILRYFDNGRRSEAVRVSAEEIKLSEFRGTYPRATILQNGSTFLTFDSSEQQNFALRSAIAAPGQQRFSPREHISTEPRGNRRTLGNVYPHQLPNGRLIAAYRHHSLENGRYIFRLEVSFSDDTGITWHHLSTIETGSRNGIWEPLLFSSPDGMLHVYYAREKTNNDQDIIMRRSSDGGASWGRRIVVASQSGSRDGMPAVTTLRDGSIVVLFESFRRPRTPKFVIRSVQSADAGLTWSKRQLVYSPSSSSRNAGAPSVITLPDGQLLASFMTDEDARSPDWPRQASVKVLPSNGIPSMRNLRWKTNPTLGSSSGVFWPSLLLKADGDVILMYEKSYPMYRSIEVR